MCEWLLKIALAIAKPLTPDRIGLWATIAGSFLVGALYNESYFFGSLTGDTVGWLNRWQTLATGGIAILAAIVAATPVKKQLQEMQRQSSGVAIPALTEILDEIAREKTEVTLVRDRSHTIYGMISVNINFDDDPQFRNIFTEEFGRLRADLIRANLIIQRYSIEYTTFETINASRNNFLSAIYRFYEKIDGFRSDHFISSTYDNNGDIDGEVILRPGAPDLLPLMLETAVVAAGCRDAAVTYAGVIDAVGKQVRSEIVGARRRLTGLQ